MGTGRLVVFFLLALQCKSFSTACPGNVSADKGSSVALFKRVPQTGVFVITQESPKKRLMIEVIDGIVTKAQGNLKIVKNDVFIINAQMRDAGLYNAVHKNNWECHFDVQVTDSTIQRPTEAETSVTQSPPSSAALNSETKSRIAVLIWGLVIIGCLF
ncbi:hypothetical protein XELAEV_18038383mg [Xenopus laevis]|uniref:Uncharacterized protein n=1 Tax=Xenopus laevis TaxID=8355 RepID=A0A974C6S7_XENLA|nr:hypothetical protein XELAEV_18038383mg [Xenopus laevis]